MDVPHFVENKKESRSLSVGTAEKRCQRYCCLKMFLWPGAGKPVYMLDIFNLLGDPALEIR
jgi:hypothetical protein